MTEDERNEIITQLEQAQQAYKPIQSQQEANPVLIAYKDQVKIDRQNGKMNSVQTMMDNGIFWTTVKCPRCVKEPVTSQNLFYRLVLYLLNFDFSIFFLTRIFLILNFFIK